MSLSRNRGLFGVTLLCLLVCGCDRGREAQKAVSSEAAERAKAGLVGPLEDSASEDIISWVDGQVVTDRAAEVAKREQAIDGYLNDTDPGRAEKYGFRSGQNPKL